MKVCLITPPSEFLLDERVFCSLGILKIGAVLESAGHKVDHLDLSGVTNYESVVRRYAEYAAFSSDPVQFAITSTTPQMPAAFRIGKILHEGGFKSILGGPHPTLTKAALKHSTRAQRAWTEITDTFDVVVAGDGENAVFQALSLSRGLIDADDPKSPLWITSQAFAENPWPARHLIDLGTYNYQVDGERALSMISQLGCPFGCTFCAGRDSSMLRRIRTRPAQNVVDELLHLHDTYGVKGCMFLDDELNVNKGVVELMYRIKAAGDFRGVDWRLRGFVKAELLTDEQAEAMFAAGFRQLLIGFESGDPKILENVQKRATVEDNTRAMDIARRHGLKVKALMSVGHAGETKESILATRDWLLEVKPSDFDVTVITPYPGSPYYDRALACGDTWTYTAKSGDTLHMEDVDFTQRAQFYKGAPGSYISYVWTDQLKREDIVKLRDDIEEEVRTKLKIPFYPTGSAIQYEASMGMTKLPPHILRGSQ